MKIIDTSEWMNTLPWIDKADANIDQYIKKVSEKHGFDLKEKLIHWQDKGYVVFENVVDTKLIDALVNDIEYLKAHHKDFELFVEMRGDIKKISDYSKEELLFEGIKFNSIQTISKAAARLSLTKEVSAFLNHIFQSPAAVLQSLTFYKGSQQPAHIDYPYVRCQTKLPHMAASWIPLEDVDPASGPLAYFPGSHKTEVSGFFDWGKGSILYEPDSEKTPEQFGEYLEARMKEFGILPQVFCPKKGDVLIWHANLIHKGTPIQDQSLTRKSYVTHYSSFDAYPPLHKKQDAEKKGFCINENNGYVYDFPWLTNPNKLPSWSSK